MKTFESRKKSFYKGSTKLATAAEPESFPKDVNLRFVTTVILHDCLADYWIILGRNCA